MDFTVFATNSIILSTTLSCLADTRPTACHHVIKVLPNPLSVEECNINKNLRPAIDRLQIFLVNLTNLYLISMPLSPHGIYGILDCKILLHKIYFNQLIPYYIRGRGWRWRRESKMVSREGREREMGQESLREGKKSPREGQESLRERQQSLREGQ